MPFIPHTDDDVAWMLKKIGVNSIDALFSEIPKRLRQEKKVNIGEAMSEMEVSRLMQERAAEDQYYLNFIGAGSYEHYIPAVIKSLLSRGEWMTAYTPYQAEASQGTLQLLYEYQSMMAELMQIDVSNASLYDGASSVAEAILMAIRLSSHAEPKILIPRSLHPFYRQVIDTITTPVSVEIIEIPFHLSSGQINQEVLQSFEGQNITAVVIPTPNFFGIVEEVDSICDWAKSQNALVIAVVNPVSMALLKPPGLWGRKEQGADIVCGEAQSFGIPLSSGGPYLGFLCCKNEYIRQLPGRLVGKTTDDQGRIGYTLTLQAREQHIRRGKATSNICTNQGLLVTAATLYMSLMGPAGLLSVAQKSHENACHLRSKLSKLKEIHFPFKTTSFFHEFVMELPISPKDLIASLAKHGIEAGFDLTPYYPELKNGLLVCVTETKTSEDLDAYVKMLHTVLQKEGAYVDI